MVSSVGLEMISRKDAPLCRSLMMMNRKAILLLLATLLLLAPWLAAATGEKSSDFTFAVFGDTRPSGSQSPFTPAYLRILEELNLIGPELAFHTGDFVWIYGQKDPAVKKEYDDSLRLLRTLRPPLYLVPGNHEYLTPFSTSEFERRTMRRKYYSLDFRGAHFVMLNTELPGEKGDIAGEQLRWLEEDLEKNAGSRGIFVFMHRPMFSRLNPDFDPGKKENLKSKEKRDLLAALFSRHKVNAVFCGHEHLYGRTSHGAVEYITVGGGGAPFHVPPDEGGFLSYLLVHVSGESCRIDVMEPYHFFVSSRTFLQGGKTLGEVRVDNICYDELTLRLKGIKLTLPKASYALSADTLPASSQLGEWGIKVNASIYKVEKSRQCPGKWDHWIVVDSPGAYTLRLVATPR